MISSLTVSDSDQNPVLNDPAYAALAAQTPANVSAILTPFAPAVPPVPSAPAVHALSQREIVPSNDREGGWKYLEAIETLKFAMVRYDNALEKGHSTDRIKQEMSTSSCPHERKFLRSLLTVLEELEHPSTANVRNRNEKIIANMRDALTSRFYNQHKRSGMNDNCLLLQQLCTSKFTEVHGFLIFRDLVSNAALSADPEALKGLGIITKGTVGPVTRSLNHCLESAAPEYTKSWLALNKQKFQGNFGVHNDPGGTSNVPYLRSRFRIDDGGEQRTIEFCRFGTPTIQGLRQPTLIDPLLLGLLDAMQQKEEDFLYVNHQKFNGKEAPRAEAIRAVETQYPNFHFLSIPMDGPIMSEIRGAGPIERLKAFILRSYLNGENGCVLPRRANISSTELEEVLNYAHFWFGNKQNMTTRELEAFWGIFSASLQDLVVKKLPRVRAMNTSCKDNKDRGGTIGTIDEAVRNVLLNRHNDPDRLCELVYNALAPYMIKLEHILDNPNDPDHHRLGFLISVLDHIATLSDAHVLRIREMHDRLFFRVLGQLVPRDSRVMASE